MNNEDKILGLLEQMNGRFDQVDARLDKVDARLDKVDARLDKVDARLDKVDARLDALEKGQREIRADLETLKEEAQITRTATNTLLDWAEQAEVQIKIPLYRKAQ